MAYKSFEKRQEYAKKYREEHKEYYRDYMREWDKNNKEKRQSSTARGQKIYMQSPQNRIKRYARQAVHYALKVGKLIKPSACENCGQKGYVEADHADYAKKLDVVWVCIDCHYALAKQRQIVI